MRYTELRPELQVYVSNLITEIGNAVMNCDDPVYLAGELHTSALLHNLGVMKATRDVEVMLSHIRRDFAKLQRNFDTLFTSLEDHDIVIEVDGIL